MANTAGGALVLGIDEVEGTATALTPAPISDAEEIAHARFGADGRLDARFGVLGVASIDGMGGPASARNVALQADGKIVLAGNGRRRRGGRRGRRRERGPHRPGPVLRRRTAGPLVRWRWAGSPPARRASAATTSTAWLCSPTASSSSPAGATVRTPRPARRGGPSPFGAGGVVTTTIGERSEIHALALQPDGAIVACGFSPFDATLARYDPSGALDARFGRGGVSVIDFPGGSGGFGWRSSPTATSWSTVAAAAPSATPWSRSPGSRVSDAGARRRRRSRRRGTGRAGRRTPPRRCRRRRSRPAW